MPGFHTGRPPRNKGLRYPAARSKRSSLSCARPETMDPGVACAAWIVILRRAGLRIQEALTLGEAAPKLPDSVKVPGNGPVAVPLTEKPDAPPSKLQPPVSVDPL